MLYPIPRQVGRDSLGIGAELPFSGVDIWNTYELSWLNDKGKPVVPVGEFRFPVASPKLIESKSLKLYLNSLNGMRYESQEAVESLVTGDLEGVCASGVEVRLPPKNAGISVKMSIHFPVPVEGGLASPRRRP